MNELVRLVALAKAMKRGLDIVNSRLGWDATCRRSKYGRACLSASRARPAGLAAVARM